jgi:hypothetical protein
MVEDEAGKAALDVVGPGARSAIDTSERRL